MLEKPKLITINSRDFVEIEFFSVLFPTIFPNNIEQGERRKIVGFLKKYLEGSCVELNDDIYKPYGARQIGINKALLRFDHFNLIMATAPGSFLPWNSKRNEYCSIYAPLPVAELMETNSSKTMESSSET